MIFFENKAFWHSFAILCISVFNISAGFHCRHYRHYRQNRQNRQRCYVRARIIIYNINISFPNGFSLLFLVVNKHAFGDYHELRFNSIGGLVEFVELVEFVDV